MCSCAGSPHDLATLAGLHAHMDALARQEHPGVADVEWTRNGPRCLDCARLMRPWDQGWACGSCGRSIDAKGHER